MTAPLPPSSLGL